MTSKEKAEAVLEALGTVRILCSHCGEKHWASIEPINHPRHGTCYLALCEEHDAWTFMAVEVYERLHQ